MGNHGLAVGQRMGDEVIVGHLQEAVNGSGVVVLPGDPGTDRAELRGYLERCVEGLETDARRETLEPPPRGAAARST